MSHPPRLAFVTLAVAVPASVAAAQTGPFHDGELLVYAHDAAAATHTLWRIDPVTQQFGMLADELTPPTWSDGMEYDPWRDGVLAYQRQGPTQASKVRLWLFRAGQETVDLGFENAALSDLAPVGDGRVYLRKNGELHVLDKANQLTPVLHADGTPVTEPVRHLIYHAPTNSLIGSMDSQSANPCSGVWFATAHRLPLTPDGSALSGPILCGSYNLGNAGHPVGLDPLPDGSLLLTFEDGSGAAGSDDNLLRVDPVTLAITKWASPGKNNDLDGGVWAQTFGKAIVLDDKDNVLRVYGPGDVGPGPELPIAVTLGDGFVGHSSYNKMTDVDGGASTCPGAWSTFGVGVAGLDGYVPELGLGGCPQVGGPLPISVSRGLGGAPAFFAFSLSSAAYPLFGGTGYLLPPLVLQKSITLSNLGYAGVGGAQVVVPVPNDPALLGATVFGQGGVLDAAAAGGVALTRAIAILFG